MPSRSATRALIGGGRLIAPDAIIDDGLLDVCLIEAMSALEFVALARKVATASTSPIRGSPTSRRAPSTSSWREDQRNTDGEVFGVSRCEYRVLPQVARFLAGEAPFAASSPD